MPTATFLNLPEEKRSKINQIALFEFSKAHYDIASISEIVKKAGIAKGSIYQYFTNKLDFYLYLVNQVLEDKKDFIQKLNRSQFKDFSSFALYRLNISSIYSIENPEKALMLFYFFNAVNHTELSEIVYNTIQENINFWKAQILKEKEENRLRKKVNIDASASFFSFLELNGLNYFANIENQKNSDEFMQNIVSMYCKGILK